MKRILLAAALLLSAYPAFAQLAPAPYRPTSIAIGSGTKTATATAGAATLNAGAGVITSEALTTAAAATYTLTLTNSQIAAADQVFASISNGTNTIVNHAIVNIQPASGSVVITVRNIDASAALNGTIKIAFAVLKN